MQYKSENCMYADWLSDGVSLELAGTTPVARVIDRIDVAVIAERAD